MTRESKRESSSTLWSTVRVAPTGRVNREDSDSTSQRHGDEAHTESMTHEQVVDQIMSLNPSASNEFLEQFEPDELGMYLRHLLSAQEPRGRSARWARPNDAPAIMTSRRRF